MNIFELENFEATCIWLVGKSVNIEIIWNEISWPILEEAASIQNFNLFETTNYKYTFRKEDGAFFKKSQRNWQSKLIIKGCEKILPELMKEDKIIEVDKIETKTLLQSFIQHKKLIFELNELNFIFTNLKNLDELLVCNLLKECNIELKLWSNFLNKQNINWYTLLKNNELFTKGVLENSIIPIMQYAINTPYKSQQKAPLTFLAAFIRNNGKVWELNHLWYETICKIENL